MAQVNGVANLYLFALMFSSITAYLYFLFLKKHSWRNKFFFLPFMHYLTATAFIVIQLNILFIPVVHQPTLLGLSVTLFVLDATSTLCFGLALFLRLHLILALNRRLGTLPPFLYYLSLLLVVPTFVFPMAAAVGITCLFVDDMQQAGDGNMCQYVVNSANLFFLAAEITMHLLFALAMVKNAALAPPRVKKIWRIFTALFLLDPVCQLVGSIYSFWNPFPGTVVTYTFWLIDDTLYLLMNRILSKGFKKYTATSLAMGQVSSNTNTASASSTV